MSLLAQAEDRLLKTNYLSATKLSQVYHASSVALCYALSTSLQLCGTSFECMLRVMAIVLIESQDVRNPCIL